MDIEARLIQIKEFLRHRLIYKDVIWQETRFLVETRFNQFSTNAIAKLNMELRAINLRISYVIADQVEENDNCLCFVLEDD